jgi:hypothetical protein
LRGRTATAVLALERPHWRSRPDDKAIHHFHVQEEMFAYVYGDCVRMNWA